MNKTIPQICTHECVSNCYKASCPRGSWNKPVFQTAPMKQIGSDTECPVMQFPLKNPSKAKHKNITVSDTWDVCAECKFSDIIHDKSEPDTFEVNISASMKDHCMDCPVMQIRDAITENTAEGMMS